MKKLIAGLFAVFVLLFSIGTSSAADITETSPSLMSPELKSLFEKQLKESTALGKCPQSETITRLPFVSARGCTDAEARDKIDAKHIQHCVGVRTDCTGSCTGGDCTVWVNPGNPAVNTCFAARVPSCTNGRGKICFFVDGGGSKCGCNCAI